MNTTIALLLIANLIFNVISIITLLPTLGILGILGFVLWTTFTIAGTPPLLSSAFRGEF